MERNIDEATLAMRRFSKAIAIAAQTAAMAGDILEDLKKLPRTGKRGRNIFIKTYNRRPGNKQKRRAAVLGLGLTTFTGIARLATIVSQPIPKYKTGTT